MKKHLVITIMLMTTLLSSSLGLWIIWSNVNASHIVEVHIELIHDDIVYAKLQSFLKDHPNLLLVLITPANYEYSKANLAFNLTKQEYTAMLTERYLSIKNYSTRFSIHVHFCYTSHLIEVYYPYEKQYAMIKEAKEFFESLGLPTTDFTPGWFTYDNDTILACQNLGITNFHKGQTGTYIHDYTIP